MIRELFYEIAKAEYQIRVGLPGSDKIQPGRTIDQVGGFSEFLQEIYKFGVWLAVILALAMIIYGGYQYLIAGFTAKNTGEGRKKIWNAIIGLLLALGSVVIIGFINPKLIKNLALPEILKDDRLGPTAFNIKNIDLGIPRKDNTDHAMGPGMPCETNQACIYGYKCAERKTAAFIPDYKSLSNILKQITPNIAFAQSHEETEKTEKKICQKLTKEDLTVGGITYKAFGEKCEETETTKDCYDNSVKNDQDIICHRYYRQCGKKSEYMDSCKIKEDCGDDLVCRKDEKKTIGFCDTETGEAPPEQELKTGNEGVKFTFVAKSEINFEKDDKLYYLFRKPVRWGKISHLPETLSQYEDDKLNTIVLDLKISREACYDPTTPRPSRTSLKPEGTILARVSEEAPNTKGIVSLFEEELTLFKKLFTVVGFREAGYQFLKENVEENLGPIGPGEINETTIEKEDCNISYGPSFIEQPADQLTNLVNNATDLESIYNDKLQTKEQACVADYGCFVPKGSQKLCEALMLEELGSARLVTEYDTKYTKIRDCQIEGVDKEDLSLTCCQLSIDTRNQLQIKNDNAISCSIDGLGGVIIDQPINRFGENVETTCKRLCTEIGKDNFTIKSTGGDLLKRPCCACN